MAELGLAASIIQIAGVAADICTGLYKVGASIGHAGTEVRLIANEIGTTSQVLVHLGNVLKTQSRRQPEARQIAEQHLVLCDRLFDESKALLRILKPLIERSGQRKTRNFSLRMRWILQRSKFSLHRQSLESLKLSLNLLLSSMNYVEASRNQVSEDTFVSVRKQLEMVLSISEARPSTSSSTLPGFELEGSGDSALMLASESFDDSERSGLNGRDEDHRRKEPEVSERATSLTSDTPLGSEDVQDGFDGESLDEMFELMDLSIQRRNLDQNTTDHDSIGDIFDEFDIGDNSQALVLYMELIQLGHSTALEARRTLGGGRTDLERRSGKRANAGPRSPRFAWICSTHLAYVAASLALCEEHETEDSELSWAHDAILTFGTMHRSEVVIIYHPSYESYHDDSNEILKDTLRRRFDSIELVIIVGVGGVPFEAAERFDIRLGDVVVGETTSLGSLAHRPPTLAPRLEVLFNARPTSWWVRQATVKYKSRLLRKNYEYGVTNLMNRAKGAKLDRDYKRPEDGTDLLFPRDKMHRDFFEDCSKCTGAITRRPRKEDEPISKTHYGNAFVYNGLKREENEVFPVVSKVSSPIVFTNNGGPLLESFPCLVICGVSNYLDSHDQTQWEGYAEYMAVTYAMELISIFGTL